MEAIRLQDSRMVLLHLLLTTLHLLQATTRCRKHPTGQSLPEMPRVEVCLRCLAIACRSRSLACRLHSLKLVCLHADYSSFIGEGFNWSDNFRTRAERTSIAGGSGLSSSPRSVHGRAQSVAIMEPPVREMPKPKEQVRPDHFQERILKGDFYMD